MKVQKIASHIHVLHSDICNHPLFEGFWPIPDGVTLNSYLVTGLKTALVDLTASWDEAEQHLEEQLSAVAEPLKIDYLILNHLEPDHTGFLPEFCRKNPGVEILATPKGCALVKQFLKVSGASVTIREVKTDDTLDLGDGVVLRFLEIPNVHWPETMATFDVKSGALFSCDAFGGYGKTGTRIFDDEFTPEEHKFYEAESLRYYANIVATFSSFVLKALEKLEKLDIKVVAPSHGIVWRKHPEEVIARYKKYAGYNTGGPLEKEVCILLGTMYGHTEKGSDAVIRGIRKVVGNSIPVNVLHVPETDVSKVLAAAYKAKAVVIAAPTYEYRLFPPMAYILDLFGRKHFTGKRALRIGSWGWVGGAKKEYAELSEPLKWEQIEQYEWQGLPSDNDLDILEKKGEELGRLI